MKALLIEVRIHDGRFHGVPEWPPSPARLFQALVAGSGPGLTAEAAAGLRWLECLPPPVIAAPRARAGQEVKLFVPNNDLDSVGGDPARAAELRTAKRIRPRIFDECIPLLYAWSLQDEVGAEARSMCDAAARLYQLGRGVDMASACARIVGIDELDALLANHPGSVHRPAEGGAASGLLCPTTGSLDSLERRFAAEGARFETRGEGRKAKQVFRQAPKPYFVQVAYDVPPARGLFDLRLAGDPSRFAVWPPEEAVTAVERIRDAAAGRLTAALPGCAGTIEAVVAGRSADRRGIGPTERARIIPLPSIGHDDVDRGIRRVLVEAPSGGPLRADDLFWAFSGLLLELDGTILVRADDEAMLAHYGLRGRARMFRTVSPAVLPRTAARRRIEPTRRDSEAKPGTERAEEEGRAASAVLQALRHAGIAAAPASVRVQREPFEKRGHRAERFAPGTRFEKERLWHVELGFHEPISGPLVIGDGRFLGLGLMAPVRRHDGVIAFGVTAGLAPKHDPLAVAAALRRAVLARVQEVVGERATLPDYFTGHARDGSPATKPHLAFVFYPATARLLVIPPHVQLRRDPTPFEIERMRELLEALDGLRELRAGKAGLLTLRPAELQPDHDPLFSPALRWVSATPYRVNRHAKGASAAEVLAEDLRQACQSAGLPVKAAIEVLEAMGVPGIGLEGRAALTFEVAVPGPILLGRTRFHGGGLFCGSARS